MFVPSSRRSEAAGRWNTRRRQEAQTHRNTVCLHKTESPSASNASVRLQLLQISGSGVSWTSREFSSPLWSARHLLICWSASTVIISYWRRQTEQVAQGASHSAVFTDDSLKSSSGDTRGGVQLPGPKKKKPPCSFLNAVLRKNLLNWKNIQTFVILTEETLISSWAFCVTWPGKAVTTAVGFFWCVKLVVSLQLCSDWLWSLCRMPRAGVVYLWDLMK